MKGLSAVLILFLALPALAQESQADDPAAVATVPVAAEEPAAPAADGDAVMLDDVTVTAERKVASLQDTPISIQVFNADKLALRGIDGIFGLAANVPAMSIEPFPTHNATLRMFIRGVGTADAQVTQDAAVGVYLDGVYIARSVGLAIDTAELERIEVLRGPQGTLYGRNTTGGAINLITRRPSTDAFTMSHQLTGGERGRYLGKSSFNVPLGDALAAKFAVLASGDRGYVDNTGPGGDFGEREQVATRFDARWLVPGDWLTADYTFDLSDMQYYNGKFQAQLPPDTNHGTAELFKRYAQSQSVYSDQRLDQMAAGPPYEPSRSKVHGHALTLGAPVLGFDVRYIGAYRTLLDDQYADLGGGAGSTTYRLDTQRYDGPAAEQVNDGQPTPLVIPQVHQDQVSHELQFSGELFDGTLEFVTGAFVFEEQGGERGGPIHHILTSYLDPVASAADPDLGPLVAGLAAPRAVAFWDYETAIRNTAQAVYAQLTWSPDFLERRWHVTGGLRQSRDRREAVKSFVQRFVVEGNAAGGQLVAREAPPGVVPGPDVFDHVRGDVTYTDLSPSFNLRYDVRDDASVYFTAARAYKSGGFNTRDPQRDGDSGPASDDTDYGFGFAEGFKPEYVTSYELGLKSEWLGRRLRFNADVFDSHFRDMQTNFLIQGTISDTKARNAGRANMRGFEMETTFMALPGLLLALDYAYLDAQVEELRDFNGNNVAHLYPFVSAPPHSGVASIDWSFAELGWTRLRAYLGYNYMGFRQGTVVTEERRGMNRLDPYGILNARLMASDIGFGDRGALELALWGRNLADREYEIFATDNLPHADRAVLWGEPRTLGVDLIYRYF